MDENMSTLQFREKLEERARNGERLSDDEISWITQQSAELGGFAAGQSQPASSAQIDWAAKADSVLSKPANEINMDDARMLHRKESIAFENLPAQGSVSSHVQSMAQKNEK